MKIIKNLLALFYPRLCCACGNPLQQNEPCLCLECYLHLPETEYFKEHNNPLRALFEGRVPIQEVASLMSYKKSNKVQKILHNLKYNGQKEIGSFLGDYFGNQLIEEERFKDVDCIIPIPLHPKKERKRGYNQSEWITKGLSESMKIPYFTDVLIRQEYTETQTKKGRFSRWMNVKDVFAVVDKGRIDGKHVMVCDDVLTTGATVEAAVRKLQQAADVKVSVVTLAAVTF